VRVLLVNKYNHITGGADTYFFTLRRLLKEKGHSVAEFCLQHPDNEYSEFSDFFINGVTNKNWEKASISESSIALIRSIYNLEARNKFNKLVDKFKPDIVHIQNMFYQISPSILSVTFKKKIPVIETLHDYHLVCANNNLHHHGHICEDCIKYTKFSILKNKCYNDSWRASLLAFTASYSHQIFNIYKDRINRWISPSRFLRDKMIAGGIVGEKIDILPYPVSFEIDQDDKFEQKGDYVLFVGRLVQQKGIITMLKVAEKLSNIKFMILGTGPLENYIKNYIIKNNISNIKLIGFVPNNKISDYIRFSKFVIVPSEWYDNLPIIMYETLLCGVPLIGSNIGGIPEIINNKVGILVEPSNVDELQTKIQYLYENESLRNSLAANAREYISSNFSLDEHYNKIIKLYSQYC